MNDRNDFLPEFRNSAWWSGDTRLAAQGRANEAILQKLGMIERPDLSGIEAVQMGHVMQPIIGHLAQTRLGIELKDADYALAHPTEPWLKSHFDFITTDGKTLVEAKNYHVAKRNKFDPETNRMPAEDLAQCVHEATVHGLDRVILAVLFGGSEFVTFDLHISEQQKENLLAESARYWAHVRRKDPMPAESPEQARAMYKQDTQDSVLADVQAERAVQGLKALKSQIKTLEQQEEALTTYLQNYLKGSPDLVDVEGNTLLTWRASKPSKKFDPNVFKSAMPDIYEKFVFEVPGSRRFLIK